MQRDARDRSRLRRLVRAETPNGHPHPIWFLAFPGTQVLDIVGPYEVFALANRLREAPRPSPQGGE